MADSAVLFQWTTVQVYFTTVANNYGLLLKGAVTE